MFIYLLMNYISFYCNDDKVKYILLTISIAIYIFIIGFLIIKYNPNINFPFIDAIKFLLNKNSNEDLQDVESFNRVISKLGYAYDDKQDIFYSIINPWQKKYGYCKFYDEQAIFTDMVIDCEPVYFNYENKKWLIEFWKGQYGVTTGGEIGIYIENEEKKDFFDAVDEEDMLQMSFELIKDGNSLFKREEKHWWITGFKLGEFSNPSELSMKISITFKDKNMCKSFLEALIKIGYRKKDIQVYETKVEFIYDKPYSKQPYTRTEKNERKVQLKNKFLCDRYNDLTAVYDNIYDKFSAIKEDGELYDELLAGEKLKDMYDLYEKQDDI